MRSGTNRVARRILPDSKLAAEMSEFRHKLDQYKRDQQLQDSDDSSSNSELKLLASHHEQADYFGSTDDIICQLESQLNEDEKGNSSGDDDDEADDGQQSILSLKSSLQNLDSAEHHQHPDITAEETAYLLDVAIALDVQSVPKYTVASVCPAKCPSPPLTELTDDKTRLNDVTLVDWPFVDRYQQQQDPTLSVAIPYFDQYPTLIQALLRAFPSEVEGFIPYDRYDVSSIDVAELNNKSRTRSCGAPSNNLDGFHRNGHRCSLLDSTCIVMSRSSADCDSELQQQQQQQQSKPCLAIQHSLSPMMDANSIELLTTARHLEDGQLVRNLSLFPSLQITLLHPEMTTIFEHSVRVLQSKSRRTKEIGGGGGGSSSTCCRRRVDQDQGPAISKIKLFYNTTVQFGTVNATLLTFMNECYEGRPMMPLAVNVHESHFKSSHQLFWSRITGDLPILMRQQFVLYLDDAQPAAHLAVRSQAPNLIQLESWSSLIRQIRRHLQSRGYGEEAIHYMNACTLHLLQSESKRQMHARFASEYERVWPRDFVEYYKTQIWPRSGRLGLWVQRRMGISPLICPDSPLATAPDDAFLASMDYFRGWQMLTPSGVVRAFALLFKFFAQESSDPYEGGTFHLRHEFETQFIELLFGLNNCCNRSKWVQSSIMPRIHLTKVNDFIISQVNHQASSTHRHLVSEFRSKSVEPSHLSPPTRAGRSIHPAAAPLQPTAASVNQRLSLNVTPTVCCSSRKKDVDFSDKVEHMSPTPPPPPPPPPTVAEKNSTFHRPASVVTRAPPPKIQPPQPESKGHSLWKKVRQYVDAGNALIGSASTSTSAKLVKHRRL